MYCSTTGWSQCNNYVINAIYCIISPIILSCTENYFHVLSGAVTVSHVLIHFQCWPTNHSSWNHITYHCVKYCTDKTTFYKWYRCIYIWWWLSAEVNGSGYVSWVQLTAAEVSSLILWSTPWSRGKRISIPTLNPGTIWVTSRGTGLRSARLPMMLSLQLRFISDTHMKEKYSHTYLCANRWLTICITRTATNHKHQLWEGQDDKEHCVQIHRTWSSNTCTATVNIIINIIMNDRMDMNDRT